MNKNDDPAFQLLARASGFLEAARIVVDNAGNKSVLRAPVAHLVAHGLEVLMKHVLVMAGQGLDEVRKDYGHDLIKLWSANEMAIFKSSSEGYAREAWEQAKASGDYQDTFDDNPIQVLGEYVTELSRLHTATSEYALRYVAPPEEVAPVPLLLLDTFQPMKDHLAREYSRSERAKQYV